jgi:hypothetical protein
MMDDDDCGAVVEMTGKGYQSTQRKPTSVPLFPPQIPQDLTRAAMVGSQRLIT